METLIYEKTGRIIKNKNRLEKELKVEISNKGKEITIDGLPEDEYFAEKVLTALEFGFPFSVALLVKEEDNIFETLNIKKYTHKKDLEKIRARIIGTKGKTLRTLTELTKCHFALKDNHLGIIGEPEYIKIATEAMISLIQGSKQANVYAFLEKHQIKPVIDLGLKPMKKKKK